MHTIPRPPLVAVAAAALALTSCTGDDVDTADPTPTATQTVTETETVTETTPPPATSTDADRPTSTGTPSPTATGVPALTSPCELQPPAEVGVESVTFAVPEGWQVEDGNCEFLDPALEQLEEGTDPDAAVGIRISDADFRTASRTEEIEGQIRWTGARSGFQAVRIRGGAAGQAIEPEGEPVQLYLVDLDAGTDEPGATLVMSARPSGGADFDLAARALDRIAQTVRVTPGAADGAPIIVTRAEGGGTPYAVTYDRDEGCFRLHAGQPTDEVLDDTCDVDIDSQQVAGTILQSGDHQVVAGLAPPRAVVVESDAATAPYGGITTPVEGASLFAYDAITSPLQVRALAATGDVLDTATIR